MKKISAMIAIACAPFWVNAQCSMQVTTTPVSCYSACDGQATAQMTGTAPFTYMWMPLFVNGPTVANLCEGMYQVDGTDAAGCTATATINITQPSLPLGQAYISYAASCPTCCDGSIQLTMGGGTPPYSYSWSPSGGPGPNSTGLCAGTYSCCVTDANGCTYCGTYTVSYMTGTDDISAQENLNVFPGVTTDFIRVQETFTNACTAEIVVQNMLGEIVYSKTVASVAQLNEQIDVAGYNAGLYVVSVVTASGVAVRRFVKE